MRFLVTYRSSFSANQRLWMEETCCALVVVYSPVYRNAQIERASPSYATCFEHSITRYSRSKCAVAFISRARAHLSATTLFLSINPGSMRSDFAGFNSWMFLTKSQLQRTHS